MIEDMIVVLAEHGPAEQERQIELEPEKVSKPGVVVNGKKTGTTAIGKRRNSRCLWNG